MNMEDQIRNRLLELGYRRPMLPYVGAWQEVWVRAVRGSHCVEQISLSYDDSRRSLPAFSNAALDDINNWNQTGVAKAIADQWPWPHPDQLKDKIPRGAKGEFQARLGIPTYRNGNGVCLAVRNPYGGQATTPPANVPFVS